MSKNAKGLAGWRQFLGKKLEPLAQQGDGQEQHREALIERLKQKNAKLKEKNEQIRALRDKIAERDEVLSELRTTLAGSSVKVGDLKPDNVIWIIGSPRTGSTWLSRMMGELESCSVWQEPFFGVIMSFRDNIANQGYAANKTFLFGEPNKPIWLEHMKRLFLAVGEARFGSPERLVVKEPNGSVGAKLVLEAFPESGVILLVRDPRDIVASLLDAAKPESWYGYDRYEASAALARFDPQTGSFEFSQPSNQNEYVEHLAQAVATSFAAARDAYGTHEARKILVRYEDLRAKPVDKMKEICSALQISVNEERLARAVEKLSWKNIPIEKKGSGKHHRKATPGSWSEDLTPEQTEIVERTVAPIIDEFYRE